MSTVAVVAHSGKSVGGGLDELREVLVREGVTDPMWFEVTKSKKAKKCVRRAVEDGADLVFVWGGDGTVQRCVDGLAGSGAAMAIVPAGTANLLAMNLGLPTDIEGAVRVGLHGARRPLDAGKLNGEHFVVMAGAGFDARMIHDADGRLKRRFGRLAYVYTGAKNLGSARTRTVIKIDGKPWFDGRAGMVLVGNVGSTMGGIETFEGARPDDGELDIGVVTARNRREWVRALGRTAFGTAAHSPFVETSCGKKIDVRFRNPVRYEIDGGARKAADRLKIRVVPHAIEVCVPEDAP
jgi:diacylglycerol kinase (ATP)